ncbi:peptidase C39 family protein, partial [Streptomyces sp. NPDC004561]
EGCGNWPFNAAYAATYKDIQGVVTRLASLTDRGNFPMAAHFATAGYPVLRERVSYWADGVVSAG